MAANGAVQIALELALPIAIWAEEFTVHCMRLLGASLLNIMTESELNLILLLKQENPQGL